MIFQPQSELSARLWKAVLECQGYSVGVLRLPLIPVVGYTMQPEVGVLTGLTAFSWN